MMGVIDYLVLRLRADSVSSALAAIQLSLLSVEDIGLAEAACQLAGIVGYSEEEQFWL
jgi:hypothetical protein